MARLRHRHAVKLIEVIRENDIKTVAEVGVYMAKTAFFVLGGVHGFEGVGEQIETWIGVDPHTILDMGKNAKRSEHEKDQGYATEKYMSAVTRMKDFPQYTLLRKTSVEGAKLLPDHYFDLVYIDADHSYDHAYEDYSIWVHKVKEGGIIAGHDYDSSHPGVVQAVQELFRGDEIQRGPGTTVFMRL